MPKPERWSFRKGMKGIRQPAVCPRCGNNLWLFVCFITCSNCGKEIGRDAWCDLMREAAKKRGLVF